MSPGAAVRSRLLAAAAVAAFVDTRIYPARLPQKPTLPSVVYRVISPGKIHTHDRGIRGLSRPRIQIDVWSASYEDAHTILAAVEDALVLYKGPAGSGGDELDGATVEEGPTDLDDDTPLQADASRPYRVSRDFFVFHRES